MVMDPELQHPQVHGWEVPRLFLCACVGCVWCVDVCNMHSVCRGGRGQWQPPFSFYLISVSHIFIFKYIWNWYIIVSLSSLQVLPPLSPHTHNFRTDSLFD